MGIPATRAFLLAIAMLAASWTIDASADPAYPELKPAVGLSAKDVVRIQLDALRHNDSPFADAGIEITFRFASPSNQKITGPLERFTDMLKAPLYEPMINFTDLAWGPVTTSGDQARVGVILTGADGKRAAYIFGLGKQSEPPYRDCWMTERVDRVAVPESVENTSSQPI